MAPMVFRAPEYPQISAEYYAAKSMSGGAGEGACTYRCERFVDSEDPHTSHATLPGTFGRVDRSWNSVGKGVSIVG